MSDAANCTRLQPEAIAGSERLTVSPWRAGDWVLLLDGKIVATYTSRLAAVGAAERWIGGRGRPMGATGMPATLES